MNTDQQAYDRGTTIFSPDGRLYQVEYAREAVKQGAPVVGVRASDGVAFVAHRASQSPLVESESIEKLHGVDDHVAVASAGHAADTRRLVDVARRAAQQERLQYGQPATAADLATTVADHVQENTQSGGTRPYGTTLLVAGVDAEPGLYEIDPSGATREWRATAAGRGSDRALDRLEADHDPDADIDAALSLALDALDAAVDDLELGDVDAATVTDGGHEELTENRIRDAR